MPVSWKMRFYKLCLWKAYFEKGLGLTNVFLKIAMVVGISAIFTIGMSVLTTIMCGLVYCIFCFFLGAIWYKKGFADAENEVNNKVNPFVREMRKRLSVHLKKKDI